MCLVGCEGVVGAGVKCSVKVCITGCCGVSVGVGVFKILYQDQGVCQGYLSVSCQGMSKVYIGMSRYLYQGDDVGMSEGVSIVLGYVSGCLIGKACSKS